MLTKINMHRADLLVEHAVGYIDGILRSTRPWAATNDVFPFERRANG
jgi:hypothetical protein